MSRWLPLFPLLLVACQAHEGSPTPPEASVMPPTTDDVPVRSEAELHDDLFLRTTGTEETTPGTQWVWVAFDGLYVTDSPGSSNATTDTSFLVGSHWGEAAIDFAPWSGSARDQDLVLDTLADAFAGYDVAFTTVRPTAGAYTTLVITDHPDGPAAGVAPLDCGHRNASDITFVYRATEWTPEWTASAAVHELGHSFGLTHVVDDRDWLWWTGGGDRFTVSAWDDEHTSHKCMDGDIQDAPALLLEALGEAAPPPAWWDGTFSDDDGSVHEADIEKIAAAGITVGCGGSTGDPRFCPADEVTRGQMVVFLQRALGLPFSTVDHFRDDDGAWYEDAANAAADAGITYGCGGDAFCGDDPVLRDQMASFLARAFAYPSSPVDHFDDDDDNLHEADIDAIAAVGVTTGCGDRTYCPKNAVTRAQMASFLARALGL